MRGFREIKVSERITEKSQEVSDEYKKIKAQTEITAEQSMMFWDNLFGSFGSEE